MKKLVRICIEMGFEDVRTYLNTGNVILKSPLSDEHLLTVLESGLSEKFGKEIRIAIRNARDLKRVIIDNPFPDAPGSQVGVMLENTSVEDITQIEFEVKGREKVVIGKREVYVYYPDGMGRSNLKWPSRFKNGTMRNINTLTKLVTITEEKPYNSNN